MLADAPGNDYGRRTGLEKNMRCESLVEIDSRLV
jgi:hypothetical protein